MIDRTKLAYENVAMAGRELGSGPAAVLMEDEFGPIQQFLLDRGVSPQHAGSVALGIVIGLVAASDGEAQAVLDRIHADWLASH